ncbi:MAG TPA: GNAT family N-acetyltransferase [bacterium]|nr:GNAT family N-acetyltransferase [bacterium]
MNDRYTIREMIKEEVARIAVKWAELEGWNPGLHDAGCFYAADPHGFFVGELDGRPVGCVSAVRYDDRFGFLGFYIVAPEYRGRGFGLRLFNEALRYMGARNCGGDGVLARIEDYRKLGFKPAYKNRRYQGRGAGGRKIDTALEDIAAADFKRLAAYDGLIFPAKRHAFLKCWISQPDAKGYVMSSGRAVSGCGVVRRCCRGHKIGPLFADGPAAAEKIFDALVSSIPAGEELFFDAPEANPAAIALAERNGMRVVFETMRIYSSAAPAVPMEKVFGVTSFELG